MGYLRTFYPRLSIIFLFINLSHFSAIEAGNKGFSVNLIRKKSPSVVPSRHLMGSSATSNSNSAQSPINAYLGHYLMELSIGTPPINIYGIGRGELSLISQLGSSIGIKKFSQCLVPFHTDVNVSSKMSFGDGSEVLGDDVVSTPLVTKEDKTPYLVTLLGIIVGDTYLPFNNSSKVVVAKGNMLIDSGSSQLCYRTGTILGGPLLIAHFEGADVQLTPTQIFIPPKEGVFCLGLTNTSSDGGIYGNFAQSNYLIGFDLDRQVVPFKKTDCTKQ